MSRGHFQGHMALGMLALAGCGQLAVPDLRTGEVKGKISNATASGGYVYVLGAPQLMGRIDSDGHYEVEHVPIGNPQLVVVAAAGGVARAEIATVPVASETSTRLDRDAATMAAAGRIVTAVQPTGGSLGSGARFTVERTNHQNVAGPGAVLGDLPAGTWTLATALPGFHPRSAQVDVVAGADTLVDQTMDVDDADEQRGCLSTGCDSELHCSATDGRCYACLGDSHCDAGEHCDSGTGGTRTCVADAVLGGYCDSADADSKCATGVRVPTSGSLGYCSASCSGQADCPAGWACTGAPRRCEVLRNCLETAEALGSSCAHDYACQSDIASGKCLRLSEESAGFCTAPCTTDQQCIDAGFGTCKAQQSGVRYCQQ